jgi:hypothetical protein
MKRGVQSTVKSRLTPVNPVTAVRTSIVSRVRPVQQMQQQTTVFNGARPANTQIVEPSKFKITIRNDSMGVSNVRSNHQAVTMPGAFAALVPQNNLQQKILRVASNGAERQQGLDISSIRGPLLPGPGKTLSERFGLLSKTVIAPNGMRRGGAQGAKQVTRNSAGVVMPF